MRRVRPISRRSRKPRVASTAVRAPRRSRIAFVPMVVPCTTRSSPPAAPAPAAASSRHSSTEAASSPRRVRALAALIRRVASS